MEYEAPEELLATSRAHLHGYRKHARIMHGRHHLYTSQVRIEEALAPGGKANYKRFTAV